MVVMEMYPNSQSSSCVSPQAEHLGRGGCIWNVATEKTQLSNMLHCLAACTWRVKVIGCNSSRGNNCSAEVRGIRCATVLTHLFVFSIWYLWYSITFSYFVIFHSVICCVLIFPQGANKEFRSVSSGTKCNSDVLLQAFVVAEPKFYNIFINSCIFRTFVFDI